MTLYDVIFYVVSLVVVAATAMAITRRNLVHAVVYLIFSFFGTAILFYLFGAPLLAALEVIIYAGAIMVLFLFIVMMIDPEWRQEIFFPLSQWLPAALFGTVYLIAGYLAVSRAPGNGAVLKLVMATPREYAVYVFKNHWLSIEIVSLLLLIALIGALHLGKSENRPEEDDV
jgi:NADH-quinone oxidoreductase subunit J